MISHLKYAWTWIKVNWKFLVGFGIPVIIGILVKGRNDKHVLQKGLEMRKNQLEIEKKAQALEKSRKKAAQENHEEASSKIESEFRAELEKIEADRQSRLEEIKDADTATEALKDKLK